MPWDNSPAARRRSDATYRDPEYLRNAKTRRKQADGRCQRCGKRGRLQIDHITAVSHGGTHALSNLQALCLTCHRAKTATEGGGYRKPSPSRDPEPNPSTNW